MVDKSKNTSGFLSLAAVKSGYTLGNIPADVYHYLFLVREGQSPEGFEDAINWSAKDLGWWIDTHFVPWNVILQSHLSGYNTIGFIATSPKKKFVLKGVEMEVGKDGIDAPTAIHKIYKEQYDGLLKAVQKKTSALEALADIESTSITTVGPLSDAGTPDEDFDEDDEEDYSEDELDPGDLELADAAMPPTDWVAPLDKKVDACLITRDTTITNKTIEALKLVIFHPTLVNGDTRNLLHDHMLRLIEAVNAPEIGA